MTVSAVTLSPPQRAVRTGVRFRMAVRVRSMNNKMWIGIAIGAGIGVAYALSARNKRSRWDRFDPKEMSQRLADNREDLVHAAKT